MIAPRISVVIATHNRPLQLANLLGDLSRQESAESFEVIVTDDGSAPPAALVADACRGSLRVFVTAAAQAGPAAARNRALDLVQAPLILFLNDDVRLARDVVSTHLQLHACFRRPTALLGTFDFAPAVMATPLNRIATEIGIFGTATVPPGVPLGPLAFCTGNLSVPAADVRAVGGFDPSFPEPAGEDLDLGYRLMHRRGIVLEATRQARAWHDHAHNFDDWWRRWEMWGRAMRRLARKHCDPLFYPGGAANATPHNAAAALARLRAQEPAAMELFALAKRIADRTAAPGEIFVHCLGRRFALPEDEELLLRVALNASMYVIQRAFWEAESDATSRPCEARATR
ncbi:MAG: glycosyltransferase family 2 protein [Candidatus Schekmanbacteria bacterium]|nr:glycosyltransferase family 2 protein [Candidatus Schekmanbacteria bacterium]